MFKKGYGFHQETSDMWRVHMAAITADLRRIKGASDDAEDEEGGGRRQEEDPSF